ncbi:hypothetical protein [Hyphomonas sp.]|uniref:hypothetical protein n=1 Tax=Hyphomonas sp. TaxID=87 RepID=UPI00391A2660
MTRNLKILGAAAATMCLPLMAAADPVGVHAVRDALIAAGLKGAQIGILSGQPMVSGDLQGIGTVAALRRCTPGDPGRRVCEEVGFKACVQMQPTADRLLLLELANEYNLSSYAGTMVIDDNRLLGDMSCVTLFIDLRDENVFAMDEVYHWSQALTDFRSYLLDTDAPVLNRDQL